MPELTDEFIDDVLTESFRKTIGYCPVHDRNPARAKPSKSDFPGSVRDSEEVNDRRLLVALALMRGDSKHNIAGNLGISTGALRADIKALKAGQVSL